MKIYVIINEWAYWEFAIIVCAESEQQAFEISWASKYWRNINDIKELVSTNSPSILFELGGSKC